MTSRVDVQLGAVVDGDESWPFDVDLATGAARIVLAGRVYVVRPLLWGERLTLARFAATGEAFQRRQMLNATLDQAPPEGAPADALAALASWLNQVEPGSAELPLDAVSIARVSLDVCRHSGLTAAQLDAMPAPEVELLCRAVLASLGPVTTTPADALDGSTRIVIIPDRRQETGENRETLDAPPPEPALASLPSLAHTGERGPHVEPPTPGDNAEASPPAIGSPPTAHGTAPRQEPSPPARAGRPAPAASSAKPSFRRVRVLSAEALTALDASEAQPVSEVVAPTQARPQELPVPASARLPEGGSREVFRATPYPAERTAAQAGAIGPVLIGPAPPSFFAGPDRPAGRWPTGTGAQAAVESLAAPAASNVASFRHDTDDRDSLFEELSRRLEQAAADLGIDTEA